MSATKVCQRCEHDVHSAGYCVMLGCDCQDGPEHPDHGNPERGARCNVITGREGFGDDRPLQTVHCLLPAGHDGPHADWVAWLGVDDPDFSSPGASVAGSSADQKET